jgi:hypothetical protein
MWIPKQGQSSNLYDGFDEPKRKAIAAKLHRLENTGFI